MMSSIFLQELWPDSASVTYPSPACVGSTQGKDWHYCDGRSTVWYNGCCRRRNSTCDGGKGYICSAGGFKNKQGKCCPFPPGKARGPPASVNRNQGTSTNPASGCQNCKSCEGSKDIFCGWHFWYCQNIGKPGCETGAKAGDVVVDPLERYMPLFILGGGLVVGAIVLTKVF